MQTTFDLFNNDTMQLSEVAQDMHASAAEIITVRDRAHLAELLDGATTSSRLTRKEYRERMIGFSLVFDTEASEKRIVRLPSLADRLASDRGEVVAMPDRDYASAARAFLAMPNVDKTSIVIDESTEIEPIISEAERIKIAAELLSAERKLTGEKKQQSNVNGDERFRPPCPVIADWSKSDDKE